MLICLLIPHVTSGLKEAVIKNNDANCAIQNNLIPLQHLISLHYSLTSIRRALSP